MQLVVDGLIFQKEPYGGIARLYRETLPLMCDLAPELHITLFIDGPLCAGLPGHSQIQVKYAPAVKRTLRAQGAWRKALYPFRRLASRSWNYLRQLWLQDQRYAIWHSTYYTWPEFWRGPQVVTVHDMIHERFPFYFSDPLDEIARRQKKRCIEQASAVICVSQATRQDVERYYPKGHPNLWVIPNACSPIFRQLKQPVELSPGLLARPFLLYVGKRVHYKNFTAFLDAYDQWKENRAVDLVVVGEPWSRAEQQRLTEEGLLQKVHLLSDVDDVTLCRLYNLALALVFPSMAEGFGLPLIEAMACGCPIVASRIPSTEEVAADCPFYFELDQPASMLLALDQALYSGRDDARVAAGLERVKRFSWQETARLTLEVYRDAWSQAGEHHGSA